MTRAAFRQADIERIFRAAKAIGASVEIDLKTLVVTVRPAKAEDAGSVPGQAPDGKENWSEVERDGRPYGRENWDD